ncbi:hypothetical protein ACKI1I_21465 [Streptomyces turgidiscabies]|uniref:hypothetical protein n=1 Tax=Streptomyces turgidiscabies TaxID=85558 RepID=UPI00076EFBA2|nr:hypothetical protein [Streptomyces turgidiscabies]MDX3496516.1 hypothetical protein [Streptomyces turgidiscabies]GAQ72705.1 hypothetical protein T45_04460 [Streptomyces turgidiscabies]
MKRYLVVAASSLLFAAGTTSAVAAPTGAAEPTSSVRAAEPMRLPAGPVKIVKGDGSEGGPSVKHVNYCNDFVNYGTRWAANCNVDYGRSGAWTQCSDFTEIRGPLVGPGYWQFGGNCSGHGTVRDWGVYDG